MSIIYPSTQIYANSSTNITNNETKRPPIVKDDSALKEGFFGLACGLLFGITLPLFGHPFDTIKTKMQAQGSYMKGDLVYVCKQMIKHEGFLSFYKGLMPPLIGSAIFRSLQFGVYNFTFSLLRNNNVAEGVIPYSGQLEYKVILSAISSATFRTLLETPLEFIKVRRQVGANWYWKEVMTGFSVTWIRTAGLLVTFFATVDSFNRHTPNLLLIPGFGPLIQGGVCATIAWLAIWPLEVIKSQMQANTPGPNTTIARAIYIFKNQGLKTFYRGALPGSLRCLFANSFAMYIYLGCQQRRQRNKLQQ
eukprot:TRINITY_DN732_c2_g1_i1.p1 TRINITY_DN732_c2_g1~~TRINITY_DN732_c2_g1_i1.p1  ORF type:complete len:306 (-),score=129.10 TRINITY_DN732_c2_g1_i1:47-964(-)